MEKNLLNLVQKTMPLSKAVAIATAARGRGQQQRAASLDTNTNTTVAVLGAAAVAVIAVVAVVNCNHSELCPRQSCVYVCMYVPVSLCSYSCVCVFLRSCEQVRWCTCVKKYIGYCDFVVVVAVIATLILLSQNVATWRYNDECYAF